MDCISIQSILSHVISAGYNYVHEIRKWMGEEVVFNKPVKLDSIIAYTEALKKMFAFNARLFDDYPQLPMENPNEAMKIHVRWGQKYDVEQLFEHAIVHVLRHRRQIERFILLIEYEL